MDDSGETREKVYDVVWADADTRSIGKDGKLSPVGNTVDVQRATWTDSIGERGLATVWADPNFNALEPALYYARVIEIPTPTWMAYDQLRYGIKMSKDVPMVHQERAWTSPVWYTP